MIVILEKIGSVIIGVAAIGSIFYWRYLWAMSVEERRERKSGLQGFFKKID